MTRANQSIAMATRIVFVLTLLLAGHHLVMAAAAPESDHHSGHIEECRIGDGQVQTPNPTPAPPTIPADFAAGSAACWAVHQPLIHHQTSVTAVSLAMLQVFLN